MVFAAMNRYRAIILTKKDRVFLSSFWLGRVRTLDLLVTTSRSATELPRMSGSPDFLKNDTIITVATWLARPGAFSFGRARVHTIVTVNIRTKRIKKIHRALPLPCKCKQKCHPPPEEMKKEWRPGCSGLRTAVQVWWTWEHHWKRQR